MSKPWADQPFSLLTIPGQPGALSYSNIAVMSVATEMANVHNALLRGLNSIYLQAPHVTHAADIADLLFYTKAWTETVNHHHELEETIFFPRVHELAKEAGEVEGMMTRNVEQHHTFEPKMVEMAEWVEEVKQGRKEYDSKALLGLIDSFGPVLMEHLHDEIGTLIGLQKCNGEEIKRAMESVVKAGQNSVDPVRQKLKFVVVYVEVADSDPAVRGDTTVSRVY
jgi:hemerythrin-like domain-containing protein